MLFLQTPERRPSHQTLRLGLWTAVAAGFVNVCSVMTFFAFSSNVTGHVAVLAEELVKGRLHQVSVVMAWTVAFVFGAFLANMLVHGLGRKSVSLGHAAPVLLQVTALSGVAHYGHVYYLETLQETEYLVGFLLLSMGLQNGTVSTISNSVVRTTHLTGLCTDLGMELSMMLQRRFRDDAGVRFKLRLHLAILFGYIVGGLMGGFASTEFGLLSLHGASALLLVMLGYDLILRWILRGEHAFVLRRDAA